MYKYLYDESPTASTKFDECKFSLDIGFYIAFKIAIRKKGVLELELSKEFGLRLMACWAFNWKIQQAIIAVKSTFKDT